MSEPNSSEGQQPGPPHELTVEGIRRKYSHNFAFYRVKAINEMLYGHSGSTPYLDLCESRAYSDESEYLRRVYFWVSPTGREELYPRLRMCFEYYSKQNAISYEYPTMILTNTKDLFMRRHHRLRKILAGEGSEDYSEEEEERLWEEEGEGQDILQHLDSSSEGEEGQEWEQEVSLESEECDLYGNEQEDGSDLGGQQEQKQQKIRLKITEEDVEHLMATADSHIHTIPSLSLPSFSGKPLRNIQNNLSEENSISVTPIEPLTSPLALFNKKSNGKQLPDRTSISYANLLESGMKFDRTGRESEKEVGQQESTTRESMREELAQMESRRRRIREKAEELLKRVRAVPTEPLCD